MSDNESTLFPLLEVWEMEWVGMPEFNQEDLTPWKSIYVHFESPGDLQKFADNLGKNLTENTRSVWFPDAEIGRYANKRYADES